MKTVLITGVSRGIGKALAERFLANGDFVIGTSTSGKVDYRHKNLMIIELDLADPNSIEEVASRVQQSDKKIDILINNAAILIEEEVEQPMIVVKYLRKTLEINLVGTIDFTDHILPFVNGGGHIINISSRAGSLGDFNNTFAYPGYSISKAALNAFTRALAVELKGKMTVSSVHPGFVRTDMGGEDAPREPTEAAEDIFKLVYSNPATGQFWYKDKNFPW